MARELKDPRVQAALQAAASGDLAAVRQRILDRATQIATQNFFEMLGVTKDSTLDQIQNSYFALAKLWHPDRLPSAAADLRDQASKIFAHLSEAHQTLTNEQRRNDYMKLIHEGGATPEDQAIITSVLEAATKYRLEQGKTHYYAPHVMHSTAHPEKAWVIRVTGTDLDHLPRFRFDPRKDKIVAHAS